MKKYNGEWIAFTKERELIVFDSEEEAKKELKDNRKIYTRIFAGARYMIDDVESLDDRKQELTQTLQRVIDDI